MCPPVVSGLSVHTVRTHTYIHTIHTIHTYIHARYSSGKRWFGYAPMSRAGKRTQVQKTVVRRRPSSNSSAKEGAGGADGGGSGGGGPARRQQKKEQEHNMVAEWKGAVGKFLFKSGDDPSAYFVQPLTKTEVFMRDVFHGWISELRSKLRKKREGQLKQALARRNDTKAGGVTDVHELRERLLKLLVSEKRAECESQVERFALRPWMCN